MKHDLVRVLRRVMLIPLAPVVADRVRKYAAILVEGCRGDATTHVGVALKTVLGILVPEVEGSVGAGGAECAMNRVE